jgi:hypothetical protein
MKATAILGAIAVGVTVLVPMSADAQWPYWPNWGDPLVWHGNDTGGVIPWSCENEAVARQAAAGFCARYNKYARITGVNRQYGDFISFNCLWTPNIGPFDLPAVPTRAYCPGERRLLTK